MMPNPPVVYLPRPDGASIAYRVLRGPGAGAIASPAAEDPPVVLMLHATLSAGWQLRQLARQVGQWATVILPDRRGSAASRLATPRPVELAEHVADAAALLDEVGVARVTVFGHSYGAIVALALAAAHPDRVRALVAYEPPFVGAVNPASLRAVEILVGAVLVAHATGGAAAATQSFLRAIGAPETLATVPKSTRAVLLAEGDGVLADIGLLDSTTVDLARVQCPALLVTGSASAPFYASIADAAAAAMPRATRVTLAGLRHEAPITDPTALAELVHDGAVGRPPSTGPA